MQMKKSRFKELKEQLYLVKQTLPDKYANIANIIDLHPEFLTAPSSCSQHHEYKHGLLEHSINVAEVALNISAHYGQYDRNLIVCGALLHDLGKTLVYSINKDKAVKNEKDKLFGHITLGVMQIVDALGLNTIIDDEDYSKIVHIILASHGKREWGSPVEPSIPEAFIVHLADMADSRLVKYDAINLGNNSKHPFNGRLS